ncbi:MAG: hypothetical protein ROO76_10580 [Terriglobia bacterium]|nr:hypothetical protein [Terriglobia bacterium]
MSLELYEKNSWIRKENTSKEEITGLLGIVDVRLKDASSTTISDDSRAALAFNAALSAATVALRASGYRVAGQGTHHIRTLECLEYTLGYDAKKVQQLKAVSKKRNNAFYDAPGNVTTQDLELAMKLATQLRDDVSAWLKEKHPELL